MLGKLGKPRAQLWITTKIDPKGYCDDPDPAAQALQQVAENLKQLNTSYADLILLHEPCNKGSTAPHPSDQKAWDALMTAVQKGWAHLLELS